MKCPICNSTSVERRQGYDFAAITSALADRSSSMIVVRSHCNRCHSENVPYHCGDCDSYLCRNCAQNSAGSGTSNTATASEVIAGMVIVLLVLSTLGAALGAVCAVIAKLFMAATIWYWSVIGAAIGALCVLVLVLVGFAYKFAKEKR